MRPGLTVPDWVGQGGKGVLVQAASRAADINTPSRIESAVCRERGADGATVNIVVLCVMLK